MKRKYIFSAGLIGIIFMMLGQLSFSINDTLVKDIVLDSSSNMSVINVIFLRGLITTFLILMFLVFYEKKNIFTIIKIKKYHQRGIYEVLTAICFFTGLILLPVAEVYTLLMTNPFFVTIFAFLFLKEKVGIRRWGAVVVGFIGVIFVINPQNMNFNYLFILPIIAAIFLTIRDIATKPLATKSNSFEIIFVTSLLITIFTGLLSIFFGFQVTYEQSHHLIISSIFVSPASKFSIFKFIFFNIFSFSFSFSLSLSVS